MSWYNGSKFELLVGKKILEARYDDCSIWLKLEDGILLLSPEGDCCAHSYVEHVDCSEALVGAVVLNVEDLESGSEETGSYDVIDTWGHRIITDKGICTLDMRTSHNGYYGGWLSVSSTDSIPECKLLGDF